jgi:hypothetical protein
VKIYFGGFLKQKLRLHYIMSTAVLSLIGRAGQFLLNTLVARSAGVDFFASYSTSLNFVSSFSMLAGLGGTYAVAAAPLRLGVAKAAVSYRRRAAAVFTAQLLTLPLALIVYAHLISVPAALATVAALFIQYVVSLQTAHALRQQAFSRIALASNVVPFLVAPFVVFSELLSAETFVLVQCSVLMIISSVMLKGQGIALISRPHLSVRSFRLSVYSIRRGFIFSLIGICFGLINTIFLLAAAQVTPEHQTVAACIAVSNVLQVVPAALSNILLVQNSTNQPSLLVITTATILTCLGLAMGPFELLLDMMALEVEVPLDFQLVFLGGAGCLALARLWLYARVRAVAPAGLYIVGGCVVISAILPAMMASAGLVSFGLAYLVTGITCLAVSSYVACHSAQNGL